MYLGPLKKMLLLWLWTLVKVWTSRHRYLIATRVTDTEGPGLGKLCFIQAGSSLPTDHFCLFFISHVVENAMRIDCILPYLFIVPIHSIQIPLAFLSAAHQLLMILSHFNHWTGFIFSDILDNLLLHVNDTHVI